MSRNGLRECRHERMAPSTYRCIGAAIALALVLFPYWYVDLPTEPQLVRGIGFAWFRPPPPPLVGFETMRVEDDRTGLIAAGIVVLLTIAACWYFEREQRPIGGGKNT